MNALLYNEGLADKAESIVSMEKTRQMIATYKATLFINHDKKQTDKLKLLPEFYD
jgi:N-acyl homoserine lactone hydrolase